MISKEDFSPKRQDRKGRQGRIWYLNIKTKKYQNSIKDILNLIIRIQTTTWRSLQSWRLGEKSSLLIIIKYE